MTVPCASYCSSSTVPEVMEELDQSAQPIRDADPQLDLVLGGDGGLDSLEQGIETITMRPR